MAPAHSRCRNSATGRTSTSPKRAGRFPRNTPNSRTSRGFISSRSRLSPRPSRARHSGAALTSRAVNPSSRSMTKSTSAPSCVRQKCSWHLLHLVDHHPGLPRHQLRFAAQQIRFALQPQRFRRVQQIVVRRFPEVARDPRRLPRAPRPKEKERFLRSWQDSCIGRRHISVKYANQ